MFTAHSFVGSDYWWMDSHSLFVVEHNLLAATFQFI